MRKAAVFAVVIVVIIFVGWLQASCSKGWFPPGLNHHMGKGVRVT